MYSSNKSIVHRKLYIARPAGSLQQPGGPSGRCSSRSPRWSERTGALAFSFHSGFFLSLCSLLIMSRPASRASTVRGPSALRQKSSESFLSSALARLSLTLGATAEQEDHARQSTLQGPDVEEATPAVFPVKKKKKLGKKQRAAKKRREEAQRAAAAAQSGPMRVNDNRIDSFQTLSLESLTTSAINWSDDVASAFGNGETASLLSHSELSSYASSVILDTLSSGSNTVPFGLRATSEKLAFYQSLILQFGKPAAGLLTSLQSFVADSATPLAGLQTQPCLPKTIKKCTKLLRTIHIAVGEYLAVIKRGGNVKTEVPRVSRSGLAPSALRTVSDPAYATCSIRVLPNCARHFRARRTRSEFPFPSPEFDIR